jgi:hypothetical protein
MRCVVHLTQTQHARYTLSTTTMADDYGVCASTSQTIPSGGVIGHWDGTVIVGRDRRTIGCIGRCARSTVCDWCTGDSVFAAMFVRRACRRQQTVVRSMQYSTGKCVLALHWIYCQQSTLYSLARTALAMQHCTQSVHRSAVAIALFTPLLQPSIARCTLMDMDMYSSMVWVQRCCSHDLFLPHTHTD